MSKLKKLGSMLLALVFALGMTCTAFAADSYTITIDNDIDGYTYVAYQIFAGDLSDDGTTLSNITWGTGINSTNTNLQAALTTAYGTTDAAKVAEKLTTTAEAEAFADIVASYLTTGTSTTTTSPYTITVSAAGYYLVKNTVVPAGNYAYSDYILKVVKNVTFDPKDEIPTSDKTVADINDSTDTSATTKQTSADYDIGDDVPFTLTATLPSDYAKYDTYKLIFHDEMDTGLTFNEDVVVTVTTNGTTYTVDAGCYSVAKNCSDGCTFEVQINDTNALTQNSTAIPVNYQSTITVDYTAELNTNAIVGNPGNENTMYIQYSNNPTNSGSGNTDTGNTPEETVVVFTYKLTVDKVDEDGTTPLEGAGFTLYKYDADAEDYVAVGSEMKGTAMTTFTWTGIDDGQYKLVETTVPSGYNKMTDIVFYVVAEHTDSGITSLKVTSDAAGTKEIDTFDATFDAGTIDTDVVNEKGSSLPSTGGMGTTLFYVVGGVLAAGAVVLLITKKRMAD